MKRADKMILFLLAFVQFVHIVDFMIIMPLGPSLMRAFDISTQQFGFLVSSYTFSAGVMSVAAAFFIDKFDRKNCFIFFFIGFSLGTVACAFSQTYVQLLAARILAGFFGGVLASLILSIMSDLIPSQYRGAAMGIVSTSFSLASIFGVPFSIMLATKLGWHSPFIFLGLTSLIFLVLIIRFLPSMKAHLYATDEPIRPFKNVIALFSEAPSLLAMLFVMCIMIGQFMIIPFLSTYLVANRGIEESQLPIFYFTGGICTILSSPWIGKIADKVGKQKVAVISMFASIPIMLAVTGLQSDIFGVTLACFALFFTAAGARMVTTMAVITTTVTIERRGAFMSLISSIQQFAAAVGSMIAGIVVVKSNDGHLQHYFMAGCFACALTLMSAYIIHRIKPAETAAEASFVH